MEQDYSKYSNEMLEKMWKTPYDLDENIFFVLGEFGNRKHPKTKQYCLEVLNNYSKDEYFLSSALDTLYSYDENSAITYAKEHYKEFHIHSLGSLVSLLWVDSEVYKENPKKELLVKLVKNHLLTLSSEQISEIKKDYDKFMKAYKNI